MKTTLLLPNGFKKIGWAIFVPAFLLGCSICFFGENFDRWLFRETVMNNIAIIDHVDDASLSGLPVPTLTFLVASASLEQELQCLLRRNPHMEFVIYTLDFRCAASLPALFEQYGIGETEVIQIAVSKLGGKNTFTQEPAPWVISGRA